MKRGRLLVSVWVVLGLALVLAGCSKPPEAEQKAAKGAMEAALSAGADKYAKADFEAAKKIWDSAESQVKEKKYKEAKQGYIDAKAAFEKAQAAVEAGKKAVADEAAAAATALEGAWKNLTATAKKMGKKIKDKEAWATDSKAIGEGLTKAKEMTGSDPAGAKAKLDELKGMIEKWEGAFKKMAAARAKPVPAKKEPGKKGKK